MEHPIFSLSTKPDTRIRRYESPDKQAFIEVIPSTLGLATIHDRDVLIFCISQIMTALNEGVKVSQTVQFKAYDLLQATNRPTGGESYQRLKEALERLRGTTISTNIMTGGMEQTNIFGLIENARIVRETREGRMQEVEIRLSDWVFNAIRANEVLTLHRGYFRLRKPLERRLYEIGRKHCGPAETWRIGLDKLQHKCGSSSTRHEFKRLISKIVADDQANKHIPDYALSLEPSAREGNPDNLVFTNRQIMAEKSMNAAIAKHSVGSLDPETYHDAKLIAPGWDPYAIEQEWREWMTELPRNPNKAFLGFCRKWVEKRGPAR